MDGKTLITNSNHQATTTREATQKVQATEEHGQDSPPDKAIAQGEADTKMHAEANDHQPQEVDAERHITATAPTEVSPKEWQKHHGLWLNAVMRAAIGEENHPPIPNLQAYVQVN